MTEQHDIIVCNSWDWNIDNPFNPEHITDILEHMYWVHVLHAQRHCKVHSMFDNNFMKSKHDSSVITLLIKVRTWKVSGTYLSWNVVWGEWDEY